MTKPEQMKSFCDSETNGSYERLEDSVNSWLTGNPEIEIVARQAVSHTYVSERGSPQLICTIFIFFRQK